MPPMHSPKPTNWLNICFHDLCIRNSILFIIPNVNLNNTDKLIEESRSKWWLSEAFLNFSQSIKIVLLHYIRWIKKQTKNKFFALSGDIQITVQNRDALFAISCRKQERMIGNFSRRPTLILLCFNVLCHSGPSPTIIRGSSPMLPGMDIIQFVSRFLRHRQDCHMGGAQFLSSIFWMIVPLNTVRS